MPILRAGIPAIDQTIDPKIAKVLMALKENVEISSGMRGGNDPNQQNWKRRSASLGMLVDLGVITEEQARSVWQEP
jgi:hypothetical protein